MLRSFCAVLLLSCGLGACTTVAPNRLSALETADLRFTSLEVRVPETAPIAWSSAEDDYLLARNLSQTDPALARTPEAKAYMRERAAARLKAALDRVVARRQSGTRPVRVVATLVQVDIPSAARRVLVGGYPSVKADVEVYDARSNTLLTTYRGAQGVRAAGQGIGGVMIDAALTAGGMDDLYDRAARDYADGFENWLSASQG